MLSQDKAALLNGFLGALQGQAAARLAMAIEVDRMMDGNALPHDDILRSLRPALRRDNYDRTPSPMRLLCAPFQDLLSSDARQTKQKGIIARTSLMPAWDWLSQSLLPAETAAYAKQTKALVLAHKVDEARQCAAEFWPIAGNAILAALRANRAAAEKSLGGVLAAEDVREMGLLLTVGQEIEKVQAVIPHLAPSFNEHLVWEVREIYDRVVVSHADAAPYIAVVVMNRLARPWEALRLPMLVTRHNDETLLSQTDMGLVGEILFARMEALKTAIKATRHPLFEADALLTDVKTFAGLSSHITKEIELHRKGEWGKRLLGERVEIGKVMETFMDRAVKEISAALPMHKATGADFSRHPGAEKHEMARRYTQLVSGSRHFAAAASFAAKQKTASEEICTLLRRYNEDLVKELKARNPERAAVAQAQFELCAEMTAKLFSDEEAELLKRRARAAQAA